MNSHHRVIQGGEREEDETELQKGHPVLHLERFNRFAHHDRDPFPCRCRMTSIHRHGRNLRGPRQIRNLVLSRISHYRVRQHALLPVRRPWRAQP
jgi:hypothetical protein